MKQKQFNYVDDEIDLSNIIKKIWREKILVLFVSIGCLLSVNIYLFFQTQTTPLNYYEITVTSPSDKLFKHYPLFLIKYHDNESIKFSHFRIETFTSNFNETFNKKILSPGNILEFLNQNKNYTDFNEFFKLNNNLNDNNIVMDKFGYLIKNGKIVENEYYFFYPTELNGSKFITEYFEFTKTNVINLYKNYLISELNQIIEEHELALRHAKLIDLYKPANNIVYTSKNLFFKGATILSEDVLNLKNALKQIEIENFNFSLTLNKKAKDLTSTHKDKKLLYSFAGFVSGFFLSLVIIFSKNILRLK
jgi:LPS O-antigen subunit length determinant protein (WzzB/FepE family)